MHKDLGVYDSIKNAMDKDTYNKLIEDINIPKNFIENPVESFKKLNASISNTAFKKFIDNNKFLHDCVKYTTIRTEALLSDGANIAKSPFEIANLNENADSKLADVIGVNIDRAFGTNGMDDEEAYNKALNNKVQALSDAQNKTWNTIKNIPRGIWEDIKTTADINKIKDFILNPDMSLDDAVKWSQSAINTVGLIGGARAFVKGKLPVTEKVEVINECSIPPEIEDINKLSVDKIEEVNTGGEGVSKAGVGKTGEGIPLEEVKPDVLKQIHADDNGAYGYLPNEGIAYDRPEYDFTDVNWTKEMQNIRKDYLEASKQLEIDIERMTSEGFSNKEIANHVVDVRNQQKVTARANMTVEERAGLEARNTKDYGNPIGPDLQWLYNDNKKKLIKKGIYERDEQVWETIIQKSMKKDDVINTLLGLIH